MEENQKTGVGGLIGTIIIIALIVLGGLYFWGKRIEEAKTVTQMTSETSTTTDTVKISRDQMEANLIKSTSPSDDLNSIENDLKSTNMTNLDAELHATTTQ